MFAYSTTVSSPRLPTVTDDAGAFVESDRRSQYGATAHAPAGGDSVRMFPWQGSEGAAAESLHR